MTIGQVFGCTSEDVDLIVWRDKNRVASVSTYHGLTTTRCGDTLKPTVVQDYNICMGGVDRKDQQLAILQCVNLCTCYEPCHINF
ncbi:unnamed protein product [Euphydryas editha]|uniref:PiggyBac transposable element-derived protein domain-containing protein n=1 Tax=Euphydryas editha TaxID=104508 RepID=A0AAU9TNM1_EUPED|nr:unnamed protein product [Euphydryas editha]